MITRITLSLVCTLLVCLTANAQRLIGVATGNYSPTTTININPACIGGNPDKYVISVIGLNTLLDNNLGRLNSIGNTLKKLKSEEKSKSIFSFGGNSKFNMIFPMADINGPAVIMKLDDKNSIALTTCVRVFNEFYNFDKLLYSVVQNNPDQQSFTAQAKNFKWTLQAWSQAGLSYGGIISETDKQQVKIGLTVNLLGGIAYAGMYGNNIDLAYNSGADSFYVKNTDVQFYSSVFGSDNPLSASKILGNVFGGSGKGFSINAGVMYLIGSGNKYRNDNDGGGFNYKVALSASITDLGSITYDQMYISNIKGSAYLSGKGLASNITKYEYFNGYIKSRGLTNDITVKASPVYLPTAVILGVDYHIHDKFFLNLLGIGNLANDSQYGNRYFSQITLTPRYDTKSLSGALPITYNTLTKSLRLGLGFRYKGFVIGSDDVLLFVKNHEYGLNFYAGAAFALNPKKNIRK